MSEQPLVGVIMGSRSDWETMTHTVQTLETLGVPYEVRVVSAHRTPDLLFEYAGTAESRGLEAIIAGAGGAAHLPGMAAAKTALPVLGVPVESRALKGMDSLLSIVQMPAGIPVATFAIGRAGAVNAALFAASLLANKYPAIRAALHAFRTNQTQTVLDHPDPSEETSPVPESGVILPSPPSLRSGLGVSSAAPRSGGKPESGAGGLGSEGLGPAETGASLPSLPSPVGEGPGVRSGGLGEVV